MRVFEIYIDDDRYNATNLVIATADDEAAATEHARRLLAESPHHRGVEVWENGVRLFGCGSLETPR